MHKRLLSVLALTVAVFAGIFFIYFGAVDAAQSGQALSSSRSFYSRSYLYRARTKSQPAVEEFLETNFSGNSELGRIKKQIPQGFLENSRLVRKLIDKNDKFLMRVNNKLNAEHFYYTQKIQGIPVYKGTLAVHLRNGNEVYAVDNNLTTNLTIEKSKLKQEEAIKVALEQAKTELASQAKLVVVSTEQYVLNMKILGMSEEDVNYRVLAVTLASQDANDFRKTYSVDLVSGKILHTESKVFEALNRTVSVCTSGSSGCTVKRREGEPVSGDTGVDRVYNGLGLIYNYYNSNYSRDGYDNRGSPVKATIDQSCDTDAGWTGNGNIFFCKGVALEDVAGHEYTHGLTESTANLSASYQGGALNESISDIFATAIDNDWTLAEDYPGWSPSIGGRDMSDPTRSSHPDRLYSSYYKCTQESMNVHANSGVMNKAFYLMSTGGSFNGCTITGVGKENALKIVYRALTTYLTSTGNYFTMYEMMNRACDDLYQPGSQICLNVRNSMLATEMDQQNSTSQRSSSCNGGTRRAPQCNSTGVTPTVTLQPTITAPQPTLITPSPTIPAGTTGLSFSVFLHGLGKAGDNVTEGTGGNLNPIHPQRTLNIEVYNAANQLTSSKQGSVSYNSTIGNFQGVINLGSNFSTGVYQVKVKVPQYLGKTVPGIISLTSGQTKQIDNLYLVTGDINSDNSLSLLDYNIILDCYANLGQPKNCTDANKKLMADITDDGNVNQFDYNLFLRELSVQSGQ